MRTLVSVISLCIYIYIAIMQSAICNHENNVLSQLSPQWHCGNSCTWAHDVRLYIDGTNEPNECSTS